MVCEVGELNSKIRTVLMTKNLVVFLMMWLRCQWREYFAKMKVTA